MPSDARLPLLFAAVVGVCVAVGLAAAGYLIGSGATRFRTESRTVTVKGLVEREDWTGATSPDPTARPAPS